jgi:hypothetical protein
MDGYHEWALDACEPEEMDGVALDLVVETIEKYQGDDQSTDGDLLAVLLDLLREWARISDTRGVS